MSYPNPIPRPPRLARRTGRLGLVALLSLTALAGCTAQVPLRPTAPAAARLMPAADETVGVFYSPEFLGRIQTIAYGPATFHFELGRGGAPMIQEVLQSRFTRTVALSQAPPLPPTVNPELQGILVPTWQDFTMQTKDAEGQTLVAAVLELTLQRRDGRPVWTRTFSGQGQGIVHDGTDAWLGELTAIANRSLEEVGAALATALAAPEVVATLGALRQEAQAQAAAEQQAALRQQARRVLVHPFVGRGPAQAQAAALEGQVVARLLASGRIQVVASGEQQARIDTAVREVNREAVTEEDWVRLGQGRGAELLLAGELVSTPTTPACSVKVELTDLATRLVRASFFRALPACDPAAVTDLVAPAAQALLDGM